ncbi:MULTISPECIES: 3-oxoacyl-[acyl-carrier-protein] synthase III C-terminal domain-containing protein [Pseudanabaena]|uniref:3-Oxoacyl-(Acyl-carrier-protein (ACP)) synthase III n=2 Tax=Pseudanabaena TaxID=1152 RepID=L8MW13_9CYAN|nr:MULTISPECIES: 3-oxoacyl-[acyl-carrier-protein] synthase III C-terminal domain-containing protein [Pseudanabaena]ELS32152.1 3-Oxoacyl-(acyl-carrier-protein (ACP)) synthase III [Pseudanabaena biceps PCC 7429]MDG3495607.1 3-oxoacyl-[acyl-carrier-protein] synthase III C-terminal domain-containing protein [Pseudanabaena catenata USMAC16]
MKIVQSVGIRSLAVSFPHTIRTNQYWQQKFPELFQVNPRQRRVKLSEAPESKESSATANGIDLWLQELTTYLADPFRGSVNRHVVSEGESSLLLECQAAQDAIRAANLSPDQIDLALVSSLFPDTVGTGLATQLAERLGLTCPAWNLESTCASALIALHTAQAFLQTGTYRHILIVASHLGSQAVNEADTLSLSMGDGAGAMVVSSDRPNRGLMSTKIVPTTATIGAYIHGLAIDAQGNPRFQTSTGDNASSLGETAVDRVRQCCLTAIKEAGVSLDQIHCFAFNTPTAWYASVCAKALGIDPAKVIDLYPLYANLGPVFPIANLYHATMKGKIRDNDLVLVYANGAAATAAAIVMRWGDVGLGSRIPPALNLSQDKSQDKLQEIAQLENPIPLEKQIERQIEKQIENQILPLSIEQPVALFAETPIKQQLEMADFDDRYRILVSYLRDWLTNSQQIAPSNISDRDCLATLLDSLMAIVFRHRIETDLQIRVPMENFFGENTIQHLAEFLLARLAVAKIINHNALENVFENAIGNVLENAIAGNSHSQLDREIISL